MEHDGESRKLFLNLSQHIECEWRGNELTSLRVTCALLGLELVSTVRGTDRDSERVATSTGSEVDNLLRLGVVRLLSHNLVLNTGEHTELSLNSHVVLVSIVNNLLGQSDVVLIRQ